MRRRSLLVTVRTAPRRARSVGAARGGHLGWFVVGERAVGAVVLGQHPRRLDAERQAAQFRKHLEGYGAVRVERARDLGPESDPPPEAA